MAQRIGTLLDRLFRKKQEISELDEQRGRLVKQYDEIEKSVFDSFKNEDIDQSRGKLATGSLSKVTHPTLKDYDKFAAFIYRNKALDLLQRRVAKGNWTDRLEARKGRPIPGVETFQQIKLNLRKRTT